MVIMPSFFSFVISLTLASVASANAVSGQHRAMAMERRGADVVPTAPGPGDVFRSGQDCTITWTAGTAKRWESLSIDLMTGANKDMVKLTNVASGIDGTSTATHSWTCPEVDPNAPVYFYQFTDKSGAHPSWTTRFTIASDGGDTVAAPNATQPDGDAIPWGIGAMKSTSSSSPSSATSSSSGASSPADNSNNSGAASTTSSSGSSPAASQSSAAQAGNRSTSSASSSSLPLGAFLSAFAVVAGALLA